MSDWIDPRVASAMDALRAERDAAITRAKAAEAQVARLESALDAADTAKDSGDALRYVVQASAIARATKAEAQVAALREALAAIVARSENGELGTSKVQDMARIARAALASKEPNT